MRDLFSIQEKIIVIEEGDSLSNSLTSKLLAFSQQHYAIEDAHLFVEQVLRPKQAGDLITFYGEADELIGYTRICRQKIMFKHKTFVIYSGNTYHNQVHPIYSTAARLGLTQTMKYKLIHPDEELIYISRVGSPEKYRFLTALSNCIYPQANTRIPEHVLGIIKQLKAHYHWASCANHPMLVHEHLSPLQPVSKPGRDTHDPVVNYYLSVNPGYAQGETLLVYMPLSLNNIGHSLRKLITTTLLQTKMQITTPTV